MFCYQLFTFNKVKYGRGHIGLKTRLKFEANIDMEKLQLQTCTVRVKYEEKLNISMFGFKNN
jgi:hypothetical protein